jgi:hypothetical protein
MMRLSVRLSHNLDAKAEVETAEVEFEVDDIVPSAEVEPWLVAWSAEVRALGERWSSAVPRPAAPFVTPPLRWDVENQRYVHDVPEPPPPGPLHP